MTENYGKSYPWESENETWASQFNSHRLPPHWLQKHRQEFCNFQEGCFSQCYPNPSVVSSSCSGAEGTQEQGPLPRHTHHYTKPFLASCRWNHATRMHLVYLQPQWPKCKKKWKQSGLQTSSPQLKEAGDRHWALRLPLAGRDIGPAAQLGAKGQRPISTAYADHIPCKSTVLLVP